MFKGALFDLDGVIADTADFHFKAWQKLVYDHFQAELPAELEEKTKGVSRGDSLKVILDYLAVDISEDKFAKLADEKNEVYKASLEDLSPANILPGISAFIAELKDHNIKLALASASLNGPFILEKLGLSSAFDAIADPSKVGAGKPAPDIFNAAAASLGLQPTECIGIEDSVAGVTAINASGAVSLAVGSADELGAADKVFPNTQALNLTDASVAYQAAKKE